MFVCILPEILSQNDGQELAHSVDRLRGGLGAVHQRKNEVISAAHLHHHQLVAAL